jgi:hypothetical protein
MALPEADDSSFGVIFPPIAGERLCNFRMINNTKTQDLCKPSKAVDLWMLH